MVKTLEHRGITIKIWLGSDATYWWNLTEGSDPWPFYTNNGCSSEDDALVAAKIQIAHHFADWD